VKLLSDELPPRGTGLITGTARNFLERGRGTPLTEEQRRARHKAIYGQSRITGPLNIWPFPILNLILNATTL